MPLTPQPVRFRYRDEILEELSRFGLRPTTATAPVRLRDFLNDLYRWELRKLRDQLLARTFAKAEYAGRVIAVRRRYLLLSVPVEAWVEPPASSDIGRERP